MDAVKVLLFALLLCGAAWGQDRPSGGVGPEGDGERRRMASSREDDGPRGEGREGFRGEGFRGDGPRGDGPRGEFRGDGPRGEGLRGDGSRGDGFRDGWGRFRREEPSEEQWNEAAAFVQAHSPNRWRFYEEADEDSWLRRSLRRRIVDQYQRLEEIGDKDLQQLKIRQIEVEDEIFGMLRALPEDELREDAPVPDSVGKKLKQLVELRFAERQFHVDKLEEALREEKSKLARDEGRMNELVEMEWGKWTRFLGPRGQEARERWQQRREREDREGRDRDDGGR